LTAVLVTGSSGFVGQALSDALASRGYLVRRAVRNTPHQQTASFAVGDIGQDTDWTPVLAGCEAVVHLAAHVHVMGRQAGKAVDDFHRVNVEGSERLARQAARAGVRRFVFLSSVKVNGEDSAERPFVESAPAMPADAYGKSKAEAETRLGSISAETGMELVIVRPPLIYGAGVKANFLNLMRIVDAEVPLPLRSIGNRRSLLYVGNLVHALEACLREQNAANRTYMVSDGEDVSTPELVESIAAALGKKAHLFRFPPALLRAAGSLLGRKDAITRLTGSLQVDISRIQAELGWRPPFSMKQGLVETAVWYRSRRQ
jgi:nucleoside-diphosphate-sugar epimerase